jgi:hypothetical protein
MLIVRDAMIGDIDVVGVLHSPWIGNTPVRRGNILPISPTLAIVYRWRDLDNSIQRCASMWLQAMGPGNGSQRK